MKHKVIFIVLIAIMAMVTKTTAARTAAETLARVDICYHLYDTLPSTDALIVQLSSLDIAHYAGLPVDSLLNQLPAGFIEQRVSSYNRPDLAEVLFVDYNSDVSVIIFVHGFTYMNPHIANTSTPKQNWQVSLFKKETMAYAIIFNGSTCINGCEHQRQ